MSVKTAIFRFYEELNDFLPSPKKKVPFPYTFTGRPSILDAIQAIGIPHIEIDLIIANGESVNFSYKLKNEDHISVYPVFESLDITPVIRLRKKPLRNPRFILDVHLGKLAKYLRMLGFDCLYENNFLDEYIIATSVKSKRIILTRDLGILKNRQVTHGYWIRSNKPREQLQETLKRFDLYSGVVPFGRCINCNGIIREVSKNEVESQLPPRTKQFFDIFFICSNCKKIYWEGSHYNKMQDFITGYAKSGG
jgi:uncharacterized protein